MEVCLFCGEVILAGTGNREHAWPAGLGGNINGASPFLLPAHRTCNNRAGLKLDGPALRSFLGLALRNRISLMEDPGRATIQLALVAPQAARLGQQVVDLWYGAKGLYAYHIHMPYPNEARGHYGTPWDRPKTSYDPGVVLVVITTAYEPSKAKAFLRGVAKQFPHAQTYLPNVENALALGYPPLPPELEPAKELVFSLAKGQNKGNLTLDLVGFEGVVAKAALALGVSTFGDDYLRSPDAERLRAFMREPTLERVLEVEMLSSLGGAKAFLEVLPIPQVLVFVLFPTDDRLRLHVVLAGEHEVSCTMAREYAWQGKVGALGLAYVLHLPTRRCVGPIEVGRLLEWRAGHPVSDLLDEVLGPAPAEKTAEAR